MKLGKNYELSVCAGNFFYSTPREDLYHLDQYRSFEVCIIDDKTSELVTKEIYPNEMDEVLAYRSKEEINDIIRDVFELDTKRNIKNHEA